MQRHDGVGHIGIREEAAIVAVTGILEPVIDVRQFDAFDVETRTARHPGLDGDVGEVRVLDLGGSFDLDHPVATVTADENIGPHEYIVTAQRRLEQCNVAGHRERRVGLAQGGCEIEHVRDEAPFREEALRGRANEITLRHPVFDGFTSLRKLPPERLQPQSLGALLVRDELGFGEAHRSHCRVDGTATQSAMMLPGRQCVSACWGDGDRRWANSTWRCPTRDCLPGR